MAAVPAGFLAREFGVEIDEPCARYVPFGVLLATELGIRQIVADIERTLPALDDRDRGDVEFLKTIPAELIYSLKFMSTTEVGARFGPSSGPGIVVTLKH